MGAPAVAATAAKSAAGTKGGLAGLMGQSSATRMMRDVAQGSAQHGRGTGVRHGGGGAMAAPSVPMALAGSANPLGGASPMNPNGGHGGPFQSMGPGGLANANKKP